MSKTLVSRIVAAYDTGFSTARRDHVDTANVVNHWGIIYLFVSKTADLEYLGPNQRLFRY
jgi:hypothetical protein